MEQGVHSNYVVKFGKFHGRRLADIGPQVLQSYIEWLNKKPMNELSAAAVELIEKGRVYLNSLVKPA